MISWIQHHLIRHGRWIFITLLAVVIVAFVGTIGNTPGCTTNRSNYEAMDYYGYDLNSQREMRPIGLRLSLSNELNQIKSSDQQQLSNQMLSRIAILSLADDIGIPTPDQEQIRAYLSKKPLFNNPSGKFDRDRLTRFLDTIDSNPILPEDILVRVLEEDYRIEQISSALAGPGYFFKEDARLQAQRYQSSYTLNTASIDYADFDPEIEAPEEALKDFYHKNADRYETPERIKASYLHFRADSFLPQIGELEEDNVREHFIKNRARFVEAYLTERPKSDPGAEIPVVKFEDVRDAVAIDLRKTQANRLANETAQNFAYELYNKAILKESPEFDDSLKSTGLSLIPIEAFSISDTGSRELPSAMLNSAFALSDARYFSDPHSFDEGYAVLIYQDRISVELPPFETVAKQVKENHAAEEKRRLFYEHGINLGAKLEAELASGANFTEAAAKLGLNVETYQSFKLFEAPETLNRTALQAAADLQEAELSPMLQTGSSGLFVYLAELEIPEITTEDSILQQATNFLKYNNSMIRMNGLASELVEHGIPTAQN
ncbi:MAG: Uncharacterised protein [Opitutia bacterium UBA7350]|nr:MAG: Uncharacterised protein [Opitutae bacterium UBA7350]